MMARIPSTIVLLALGILTLFAAWRGHISGELVAGGFRGHRPNRQDNPRGFYFYLGIYLVAGTALDFFGGFIFFGVLVPLFGCPCPHLVRILPQPPFSLPGDVQPPRTKPCA